MRKNKEVLSLFFPIFFTMTSFQISELLRMLEKRLVSTESALAYSSCAIQMRYLEPC